MPRRLLVALVLVGLAAGVAAAQGDRKPRGAKRVTLDRVEVEPSRLDGLLRVRMFVSAIDLDTIGSVIAVAGADAWRIGGSAAVRKIPYVTGVYAGADAETAIVFVIQTDGHYADDDKAAQRDAEAATYAEDLETFKAAIHEELLAKLADPKLPPTQAAIIGYADSFAGGKLTTLSKAGGDLDKLASAATRAEAPVLLDAVDKAIRMLKKAKPIRPGREKAPMRKLIVIVGDGRDADEDRARAGQLGSAADKQGIRIDTIAYSVNDERRPMFTLGELSLRSQGTFRWIQKKVDASSLHTPFRKLLEEIQRQYVLTMFVPEADLPRKLSVDTKLVGKELGSLALKTPTPTCGADACAAGQYCASGRCVSRHGPEGRGFFGWILLLGGIVLAGLAALVGVGFVITKLRERPAKVPGAAVVPGAPPPAPAQAPPPVAPVHHGGPVLYVITGPQAGHRVPLRHGFTIGKAPGCDLSLAHDGFASSHHAQILMDTAGNCQLVDQNSTNGTYINGVRVQQSRLFDGMSIRCGSTELRFLAQ